MTSQKVYGEILVVITRHSIKLFKNIFSGSKSTTSIPKFKYLCNSILELLNVFEYPVQRVHTIAIDVVHATQNVQ